MTKQPVLEVALLCIKPGMETEFEEGVRQAVPFFQRAPGCTGMEVRRFVEKPQLYHLLVRWDSLESHTVDFRGSEDFQKWRACVGHCFDAPPEVYHTVESVFGF